MIKPDWSKAPADAQFYSCCTFRKKENGDEFYWTEGEWRRSKCNDPVISHKKQPDFEMRPATSERSHPAPPVSPVSGWDGKGLPPVGAACEVNYQEEWVKCEVIAHFQQRAGMVAAFTIEHGDGSKTLDSFRSECFRPIKSDRDKWIDECAKILSNEHARVTDVVKNMYRFKGEASAIYHALKSGKLPKVGE